MRFGCAALAVLLALPAAAQQPRQVTGPEAYRFSTGIAVLAPIGGGDLLPAGALPSGRATLSYQLTPLLGLHLGGLRLAPTDLRLAAGVAGVRLNLTTGRLRIAPFAEGGYGIYDAVVDSGGVMVDGVYRPFRRPVAGSAPGGGGGVVADVILGPGLTVRLTGGYWLFSGTDTTWAYPMAGIGLRLARKDDVWYWRTGGRDRVGPTLMVSAPRPDSAGIVPVGRGELRLRASDVSLVERIEVDGRSVPLYSAENDDRTAVVGPDVLGLRPGRNTVAVVAVDGAGNRTEHELVVAGPPPDRAPPRIAILTPSAHDTLSDVQLEVRGVVADESPIGVLRINGVDATVEPAGAGESDVLEHEPYERVSRFRAEVAVGAGEAVLELAARDTAGNEVFIDHPVFRPDREAPRIAVTEPQDEAVLGTSRTKIAGWVVDAGQIATLEVNGVSARLTTISGRAARGISASGVRPGPGDTPAAAGGPEPPPLEPGETAVRFEAEVNLAVGSNELAITAADVSGNEEVVQHRVIRSAAVAEMETGPVIRVEEPREWAGAGTRGLTAQARSSVRVRGTVSDPMGGAIREVRVGGDLAAVQLQGGHVRFTGYVPVQEDTREVEVAAWTGDGRYSSKVYDVRAVSAPSAPEPTVAGGFEGRRFAVVVGISDYADPRIPDLAYADDDARAFYEFLRSERAGAGGIPAENIELLLDEEATYRNLRSALFTFLEAATERDIVYVYVAGHGAPNPRRPDDLYLLPYDAEADDIPGTAFPMADVNEAISRLYAHHTVLITDACHSGGFGMGGAATRALAGGAMNAINQAFLLDLGASQTGLAILTASEARELSQEDERWGGGHGVFTHFLLEGLRGAADLDGDRIVRWGELTEYVRLEVAEATRNAQHPSIGSQSHDRYLPMAVVLESPERP
ncbi:MAG: caspase family protein [Longimicrobiales bacterium]